MAEREIQELVVFVGSVVWAEGEVCLGFFLFLF